MTEYISKQDAVDLTNEMDLHGLMNAMEIHALCNAAIKHFIEQSVSELTGTEYKVQPSDEALLRQALKAMDAAHVTCQSIHHNRHDQGHELGMCPPLERYRLATEAIRARLEGGV